jgi:hypothetical protein
MAGFDPCRTSLDVRNEPHTQHGRDGAGARYDENPNDRGRLREAASSLGAERLGGSGDGGSRSALPYWHLSLIHTASTWSVPTIHPYRAP